MPVNIGFTPSGIPCQLYIYIVEYNVPGSKSFSEGLSKVVSVTMQHVCHPCVEDDNMVIGGLVLKVLDITSAYHLRSSNHDIY